MKPIIEVEKISKRYQIGASKEPYLSLRDEIVKWISPSARRARSAQEELWALKDITFNVQEGEAVGIIGRNGAGKSTLLKILSKITPPTEGKIKMRGRVASLLEVGTGFHPELTGRENIYLNGAILGMSRQEIKKKFDEIVSFAEIEKFLDTPVKRYSSGMYVRLAFAVAAHLEPEILLVDEVLAVGDAEFQKKCLGKMGEVAKEGRTVLFVSHNMASIMQLCSKGLLVESGKIRAIGTADEVVRKYLAGIDIKHNKVDLKNFQPRRGTGEVMFGAAYLQNAHQEGCRDFHIGDKICIFFSINASSNYINKKIKLAVELRSSDGLPLCNMVDMDSGFQIDKIKERETISVTITDVRLYPDTYFIGLWAGSLTSIETFDYVIDCLSFTIVDGGKLTSRRLPRSAGILFLTPEWQKY